MSTTAPDRPLATVAEPEPTVPVRMAVRLLARRVHFMAGILIAPFLALLCLTGIAFAFTPQLNEAVYANEYFVDGQGRAIRPLSEQVDAALAAYPNGEVLNVQPPAEPDRTAAVVISVDGKESDTNRAVYVDPYTNQIRGEIATNSFDSTPLDEWLRTLHSSLHLGTVGNLYSELVASWLPLLIVGGAILWLSHQRRGRRLRGLFLPGPRKSRGRTRARGVHASLGVWLGIGLLAISVTGLTWSTYAGARFDTLVDALRGNTPRLSAPAVPVPAGATPIGIDRVHDIARADGLGGPLKITPPGEPGKQFTVAEVSDGLPIRKDKIAIDPYAGRVTERLRWADYPLPAKLTSLGIQAHSGTLFGLVNQILLALLAIGTLIALTLSYRMWWHRRPTGGRAAPAPPPVWRRLSQRTVFLIVLAAAALGWALPVLGFSLIGFVLLDAAFGVWKRRRVTPRP